MPLRTYHINTPIAASWQQCSHFVRKTWSLLAYIIYMMNWFQFREHRFDFLTPPAANLPCAQLIHLMYLLKFRNKIYLLPSFNITRLRLHPATHLFCKLPPRKQWLWYLRDLARGHRSAKLRCILSFVWLREKLNLNNKGKHLFFHHRSPNSNFWAHTLHLCLHRTPNRWTRHPFCWPRPLKANTEWKNLSNRFIVAINLSIIYMIKIQTCHPKPSSSHLHFDWCASPPLHWLGWCRTRMLSA